MDFIIKLLLGKALLITTVLKLWNGFKGHKANIDTKKFI